MMISLKLFVNFIVLFVFFVNNAEIVRSSPLSRYPNIDNLELEEDSPLSKRPDHRVALRDLTQLRDMLSTFKQVMKYFCYMNVCHFMLIRLLFINILFLISS